MNITKTKPVNETLEDFVSDWTSYDNVSVTLCVTTADKGYIFENEDIDYIEESLLKRTVQDFTAIHDPDKRTMRVEVWLV